MANSVYNGALTRFTTVIEHFSLFKLDWWRRMNVVNQNNTYRAYVMIGRFIKNIHEMYLASSIGGNNPGLNLCIIT